MDWDTQDSSWNIHLERLAGIVKIDPELIWSSRQQLISIFGEEWLRQTLSKMKAKGPRQKRGIVGVLSNPIENNAVQVVELAKYLKEFSGQRNFSEIITKLKNADDYEAIRLNLAYAFRMAKSGWQDVYVEPDLGDIEGILGTVHYVIECSMIVPPPSASTYADEIARNIFNLMKNSSRRIWIDVEMTDNPKQDAIPKILKATKSLVAKYEATGLEQVIGIDCAKIIVKDAPDNEFHNFGKHMAESRWDFGWKSVMRQPKRPNDIYSVNLDEAPHSENGILTLHSLIDRFSSKTTIDRLKTKLRDKKKQTKTVPANKRRIFVFMSDSKVENEDWNDIAKSFANGMKAEDNIDAVIFTDRRHHTYGNRLRYPFAQIHFLTGYEKMPHLEENTKNMREFEESEWLTE